MSAHALIQVMQSSLIKISFYLLALQHLYDIFSLTFTIYRAIFCHLITIDLEQATVTFCKQHS